MPEEEKKKAGNPNWGKGIDPKTLPKKTKEGCAPGYKTPGYVPTGNPRGRPKKANTYCA